MKHLLIAISCTFIFSGYFNLNAQDIHSVISDNEWFLRIESTRNSQGESENTLYEEQDSPLSVSFYKDAFFRYGDKPMIMNYELKDDNIFFSLGSSVNLYKIKVLSNDIITLSTSNITSEGYITTDLTLAKKGVSLQEIRDAILKSLMNTKVPVIKKNN